MAREDGSLARSAAAVHVVRLSARQQGLRAGARVAKRWELNTVLIVNTNNRTTVGLANNTGQQ